MTDPGVLERAIHRLDILARQLERVQLADLQRIVTDAPTPERSLLRLSAEDAVRAAGLGDLLDSARARFEVWAERSFRGGGPAGTGPFWGSSRGSIEERIAIFRTVDEAVLATVAHGLIAEPDRQALREPFDRMMELRPERRTARRDEP
jgi:hypothetical protein